MIWIAHACCPRWIARHFADALPRRRERWMRRHIAGCTGCRELYALELELEGRVHGDASARHRHDRIARALGLSRAIAAEGIDDLTEPAAARKNPWAFARRHGRSIAWRLAAGSALAALSIFAGTLSERSDSGDHDLRAKGSATAAQRGDRFVSFAAYLVAPDGRARALAEQRIPAHAALSFSYTNRAVEEGYDRLMIFGVDDGLEVHWYHPAWTDPRVRPLAIPARQGQGIELGTAIAHQLRGSRLRLFAVFSRRHELDVTVVEDVVARFAAIGARLAELDRLPIPETGQHMIPLEVTP